MSQWRTVALSGLFLLASVACAQGADRVINTAPKADAAILMQGPGLKPIEGETIIGNHYAHNEGVIIRGSRIENGKIIIPPSGLFYTNRGPRSYMLRGDVLNMLGKPYYLAFIKSEAGILSDVDMRQGQKLRILPDKVLSPVLIRPKADGHPTPVATFEVLRPSGNPVRTVGFVSTTPLSIDKKDFKPTGKPTGIYQMDENFRFDIANYTTDLDATAGKYIKVDKLTDKDLHIQEALFHHAQYILVSRDKPITGYYASGDTFKLGDATVAVSAVNAEKGTVAVSITDKNGKKTEKTLGPITPAIAPLLTNAEFDAREHFSVRNPEENVQVEFSPFTPSGLFKDGKVALNGYVNLEKFSPEMVWPSDNAYLYRPDT